MNTKLTPGKHLHRNEAPAMTLSDPAMRAAARIPLKLWVEFALYMIATIAIQMLCHAVV